MGRVFKASFLSGVALGALGLGAGSVSLLPSAARAQSSLPAVTVDAPQQRPAVRAAATRQTAARSQRAPRRVATPAPQQDQLGPSGRGAGGIERANGPVTGYLANQSATATKTDTPILETPQTISVVPKDQIVAQGAQSISDALRYTPGINLQAYGANAFFDGFKIRGFDAPRYLDGLRLPADNTTFAIPRIDPYGLERLEVLKGPSSGLYGLSEPGGLLNMVSKRPTATPHFEAMGTFGSFDRFQGAFDFGSPLDRNGEFLYRIVGLGRKSNTQTDYVQDNTVFIAPSFTWRPTIDTSFTILSHYQKIDNKGYQQYVPGQVSFLPNPNGHVPYGRYLGEPNGPDGFKLEQGAIGYAFEHRFDNNLQFRQNLRYTEVSNDLASTRTEGMVPGSLTSVMRTYNYVKADAKNLAIDNQIQADFSTGLLAHKVLVGFDYFNLASHTDYRSAGIAPINAYFPAYGAALPTFNSLPPFILRDDKTSQAGLYAQDQIKLDRWTLTLTGRQDWVKTEATSLAIYPLPGNYDRSDSASTGRVGLNYLFDFGLSPYANYSTSFVPNTGNFKPTTGEGKEVGVKFKPNGMNLMMTAALFEIEQQDLLTADPTNPFLNVQTDAVRVRGFEFEARGNITREFEIVGGYTHLDPKVIKSIAGYAGKNRINVPGDQASLWGKYTWYDGRLAGLGLGAGVRYVGDSYGDNFNTFVVPAYTVFDAAISYDFGYLRPDLKGWKAQVNAINLTDRFYVGSCLTGLPYCGLGTARTVLGTLSYSWNAEPVRAPLFVK